MTHLGLNGWFLTKPHTGIGVYTVNLLRAMAAQAPDHAWFVPVPHPVRLDPALPKNVHLEVLPQVRWLPTASLRKWFWEQVQVPRFFAREKVELAHYPYPCNPRRPQHNAPKTVVTVHDVIPWTDPAYRRRWRSRAYHAAALKALLEHADRILCVSQATADGLTDLMPEFPLTKIQVIHEAAAPLPKSLRRPKKKKGERPTLLYVGGYDTRKNVLRLVEAFAEYVAPRYAIDLKLVGAKALKNPHYTTLPELHQKIKTVQRLRGKILPTPSLDSRKLTDAYQRALALVHPSLSEGFNLPLLEAAACGTPLVVSCIDVHREIVGDNALYFDPHSTKSLGEALLNFLYEAELRDALIQKTTHLRTLYTWEKSATATLEAYRKAMLQ